MIRLIVSDMDGTLLSGHDEIHPENLAAIREALGLGVRFAVASGRNAVSCGRLLMVYGLEDAAIIATNGCQIVDKPFGKTLALHHLSREAAASAMGVFARHGLGGCLYTEDAIVYSSGQMREEQEAFHLGDEEARKRHVPSLRIRAGDKAVAEAILTTPMKVFCVYKPGQEAAFEAAKEACARIEGVELTSSWADNFEVMPKGINKGTALEMLSALLNIRRDEIMAFGDNDNDLPMLTWAGLGIAMGNALPSVKRAVPRLTGGCKEGGVAQGIRKYWIAG